MQVWTFLILGGQSVMLTLGHNPTLDHNGGRTVWKFVGTEPSAQALESALKSFECIVFRTTETESQEQAAERLALLGKESRDSVHDLIHFYGLKP
jgi:hypothetical protein